MYKFKKESTLTKILASLTLFFILNTDQAFAMKDPLQEKLGNLKISLFKLKIKLETLKKKLDILKENLEKKVSPHESMGIFEQIESPVVKEIATYLSPEDIAKWQQTSKYFKQTLESKFKINEKAKYIIALKNWRWCKSDLANFDNKSIIITRPKPKWTGDKWQEYPNVEIRFTRTNFEGKQHGPLGKYDKLEIGKTFAKDFLDRQISNSGQKYKFDTISLLIGIFVRCNWENRDDVDHKLKEVSIDASGFPLSRLVLRNLINLRALELINCNGVKILYIEQCPNLDINTFIGCIANLENLYLVNCPKIRKLDLSQCPNLKRLILKDTILDDEMIIGTSKSLKVERPTYTQLD